MSEWITPIFDRNPSDVTKAKLKVQEWIKALANGESVTITDLKGYFNASDLNRIENDTAVLAAASSLSLTIKTDWTVVDLPTQTDLTRIINNISAVIEYFELEDFTLEMPTTILTYKHANTVEHNLSLIKTLLDDMTDRIRAVFEQIDVACEIDVTVCLSIPIRNIAFDKIETSFSGKITNAKSIPLKMGFDKINILFSSKVVNSVSLPIVFDGKVECEFDCKVHNDISNPIIATQLTEFGFDCVVRNDTPNPIIASCDLVKVDMNAIVSFLDPIAFSFVNSMIVEAMSECSIAVLKSYPIKANAECIEAGMSFARVSFADMFIQALFETVVFSANAEVNMLKSEAIKGAFDQITTDVSVGITLYIHATLADYRGKTLSSMRGKTLKELSLREK